MSVFEIKNVSFSYGKAPVLKDINYHFESGKMIAIVGKSGTGKTTLLSLLAGLMRPNAGAILYDGTDMAHMSAYEYRSRYVGVIFQDYNLLTKLTALENVMLSMDISGMREKNKKQRAYELLESVGIEREEAGRRVLKLSGGQQQRVAIARALSYDPKVILADEPTGNLDEDTQDEIIDIFYDLAKKGKCVIIVTHSPRVFSRADVVYQLRGRG